MKSLTNKGGIDMSESNKLSFVDLEDRHAGGNIQIQIDGRFALVDEMYCDGSTYLYIDDTKYSRSLSTIYAELVNQGRSINRLIEENQRLKTILTEIVEEGEEFQRRKGKSISWVSRARQVLTNKGE